MTIKLSKQQSFQAFQVLTKFNINVLDHASTYLHQTLHSYDYYSLKSTECGVWWNEPDFIIRQPLHTLQIRPV